jgi:lactam utilization protein B
MVSSGKRWLVEAETVGLHADSPQCVPIACALRTIF